MKTTGVAVASGILGLVIGGVAMQRLGADILSSGSNAQLLAEATVDIAALEKLKSNDADGAKAILAARLRGSMQGLNAEPARLTDSQAQVLKDLENRSKKLLSENQDPQS